MLSKAICNGKNRSFLKRPKQLGSLAGIDIFQCCANVAEETRDVFQLT